MDLVANATSATAEAYGLPGGVSSALADVERWYFVATATLCMELTFWLSIAFHAAVRASGWFEKYRIHHSQPPADAELLSRAWTDVMVGHLLIRPPLFFVVYPVLRRVLQFDDDETQPVVLWRSALQLMVIIQIDDFLYYWVHRMLHHRLLYKHFHKQHHEFKNSVPIAAEYSSIVEDLLSSTVPTVAGSLILRVRWELFVFYVCMKLHQSMDAHCGYILPFPLSPYNCYAIGLDCAGNHDFHHSANVGCYGGYFQFWDHIMGTNTAYLKAKAKKAKGA